VPRPARRTVAEQVGIQLVEADIETGFALVDEAKGYFASDQKQAASLVLQEAAKILVDVEQRLLRLGDSEPFQPLITELRDEIAAAERGDTM